MQKSSSSRECHEEIIAADIGETTNLSAKYPERIRQLADLLTRYLKNVNVQMPTDKRTGRTVEWPADALRAPR